MEFEFKEKPDNGRDKMNDEPKTGYLVDTTDCLEAVSVIRCWKNILFIIILTSMLLLQGLFWMMNLKLVKAEDAITVITPPAGLPSNIPSPAEANQPGSADKNRIKQTARQIAVEVNTPAEPNAQQAGTEPNQPAQLQFIVRFELTVSHIISLVRILNFALIPSAVLYCLMMLFSLKISIVGRLGGINHIARAFFMSLLFIVLLLPWQVLFAPVFGGAIFTPGELIIACQAQKTTFASVSFYLRFLGYWLLVLLLLLIAQLRSMRWAKATLRRLEVV
jgi:hypothetical protein